MPIGGYIGWVGTLLLALLFVADWCFPKSLQEPTGEPINRPVIRIASVQQPPERIVIDTNQPTIVPPLPVLVDAAPSEQSQPQSYAPAARPPPILNQKKPKVIKPQASKIAVYQPSTVSIPVGPRSGSATTVPPIKMSFINIISGQLGRKLFNLN
jgi:hypothetical protein